MKTKIALIGAALCGFVGAPIAPAQDTKASAAAAVAVKPAQAPAAPARPLMAAAAPAPAAPKPAAAVPVGAATPAVAAASDPLARNIRFQFDGIPYPDVVERFAQMVNKPLVADTNIQGTLTFNDPTAYNYEEAFDTMNLILSMKGLMLVEDGHYLRLVPFKELPQMPLRILRGLEKSGDVRPGEVVTVVLDVKNLDSKEVGEAVVSMLSSAGSVAPLSHGRGLILTDRLANIQRIRTLLAAIDTEAVADRQMKAYTLLHASGAVVADLINRTFGISTAPKRTQFNPTTKALDVLPPDPNDFVTAVYDDASRTLVLFGPRDRLGLSEELISKFEVKEGGGGDVRIYYPQITKAEELATMIRQAVPGVAAPNETAAAAATKARVIADVALNRLIVAAPIAGQLDEIELLINKLDKPIHGNGGSFPPTRSQTVQVTKVFRPRSADVTSVSRILTEAMTRRTPTGLTLPIASVTVETNSQSVVVTGSPGDVQTAVDIVAQLETGSSSPSPQQTRMIDIGTVAEAKRLVPLIEQIYRSQVTDSIGGQVAHAKIIPDTETGRLIVTASPDHLKRIEEIVKQLKGQKTKPEGRHLQIIALKHLRADTGLASLNNLVAERMADKRFEDEAKPLLLPDAANSRLLVTATDEQLKVIQELVSTLDVAPEKNQREMRVVPIQSKSASELITLTTQLMTQLGEDQANPQLAPKLIPDPSGKQIIVLATAKDLERVTNLVQQLDNSAAQVTSRQFRGVELFSRNAAELTPLVQQLYQEQLKGQMDPSGGPATLLADPKNNRIMVSGSEKEIARAEAIIRQLDPVGKKGNKEETRVVRLKAALATDLASLVEKSLNTQSQKVKIMIDARSNSLVLSGESDGVEAASQIIQQLDSKSDVQPRELRIIELKQGEATTVAPMVSSLVTEMVKDQRGPEYVPQTKVVADTGANRLIVTGPKDELKTLSSVVDQLDQAPEAAGGARVFKLTLADAATMVTVVSNAMVRFDARNQPIRRVSVSADRESNSIIVAGSRTDLQDAQTIIERLDREGVERGRDLKIVDVKTDDPDALAALAMKVFTAQNTGRNVQAVVSITPEPSGKRLIVLAPATVLAQVQTVIEALDAKGDQGARELQSVELKNGTSAELLPTVNRIYTEQNQGKTTKPASIYPDGSGSRFMVYGTKEQGDAIRQIVETLESQKRAPRETRIIEVGKLAEAQRILPLAQQLYRDQISNTPNAGPPDAQMVSDGKTGRLIVSARQDQMPQLEELIKRLQVSSTTNQAARETRAFEVGTPSEVQRLIPLVQQLYQEQWRDKIETDPADAQIVGDARTGRLIVTGKPEHIKQIEVILNQLNTGKPKSDARDTRVYDLTTANAMELATTARTLYLEQAKNRLGTLVPDTVLIPDGTANRLIVVGETNELEIVEEIIKKLDKVGAQSASVRVFKIKSAEPEKVMEVLTAAMVRFDAYGRPQKRVSVSVDAKSRTLIVTGDPKELQGVSVIIEQLDTTLGAQPTRAMKVVSLKQGKAAELMVKVRQLYSDQVKAQPELGLADALILEDAASNQIILAGSDAQLKLIEQIITDLQAAQANLGFRETKMIEIGNAEEMQRLLPMLQQLYQDRWKERAPGDPADAQITPDARNARLIVTARTNQLAEIQSILAQLREGKTSPEARDTRLFDLTTANAVDLATTVRALYQDQARTRPGAVTSETLILPDSNANRLIVSGATNELDVVEDIIKKLDKVGAQSASVRVFKLRSAEPDKVSEILSSALVRYDAYGRPQKRVSVVVDAKSRTLIATGDPKELQGAAVIIEQLDSIGAQPERKMKVLAVKALKAADLSAKVKQLYQDQIKSQPELSTTDALILEDVASNQLILAGNDAQLTLIDKIVSQLQEHATAQGPRETRILEVGQAEEVTRLQPLVQQLYVDQWKTREAGDPADAQILADAQNGRLIVTGKAEHIKEIESILAKVSSSSTNALVRETRVYDLNTTSAAEISATVKTLYQEQLKTRTVAPSSQAVILPDVAANRLIVSGLTNELASIDEIVKKLDKTDGQTGHTRVFKLKTAEAEQVATLLSSALSQLSPYGRPIPRVSVGADKQNNVLIVSGEPKDLQSAAVIVEQMDTILAKEPRQMRIISLKSGVASELATKVKELYQDQMKGQPKGGAADALIMGDEIGNRLIITASDSHMKVIEDMVKQLQQTDETTARQTRIVLLQRNSAASIATMISQLFARQISSQDAGEHLVVTPSADDRTLVLDATPAMLDRVSQLVKSLDGEAALGKVEVRTYNVPEGSAAELAPTLARLFAEKGAQTPAGEVPSGLAPRFEANTPANMLIVAATKDQFVQIDKLIEDLKKSAQVANEIRTFKLKEGDPAQIAEVLQAMLTDSDPRQGGDNPRPRRVQFRAGQGIQPAAEAKTVRVAPAPSLNAVVVQGPPEKLALAEKLIQTLDGEQGEGRKVIQTVHLKKAHAENLAEAVSKTMTNRWPSSRSQRVSVTPVIGPNSLLLHGPSEGVEEVLKIIRELDTESEDDEIKVHIYKLENGNAKEVSAIIEQLLESVTRSLARTRATAGRPLPATVAVDEHSNSLVVSGTATHFKVVEQMLQTLDKLPTRSERDVSFVWLHNAKALDVVSKLEAVFAGRTEGERPVIEADSFNNSITIIGKRADLTQVQDLVNRLDETSRDSSLQVRLRPLDRVPAEQMARMLQNIYPQMSTGQIRVVEKVQPVTSEKTAPPTAPPGAAQPAPAPAPAPGAPAGKKEDKTPGEVVIGIDKSANALILSGPTHELDQIDRIISELSYSYISSDAEFRVFPLKEADPVIVARTLTELFRPEQIQVQQPAQALGPGQIRTISGAPKITVVAEPRARSVIVRAKATDFTLLETLIKQLDTVGVSSQLEFRLVALTNAPPEKVAPLVQQMVTQLSVIRPGEPLTVMPDPRSRSLLVVARDTVLTQVEKMIHSLDTPSSYAESEVLVLSLKKATAPQLATVLQTMLRPGTAGELTPEARELQEQVRMLKVRNDAGTTVLLDLTKPIKIMADPATGGAGGNRLILSSTPDNLKALAAVVEMMDAVPVVEGVTVRLVHLEFADAASVSQTLSTIFTEGQRLAIGPGGRAEPEGTSGKALVNPLNVAIDPRSNTLILSGQKESIALADRIISDLDRKVERFTTEVRLFRLKHGSATRLAPLVQSVFAEGPAVPGTEGLNTQVTRLRAAMDNEKAQTADVPKARPALLVQADDTSNILIVAARADTMPLIETVINQLDIPAASGLDTVRIYPLNHADPATFQKVITDLYTGPRAAQMRTEDKPNVTIDERTQALIISGNSKAFAIIDSLLLQLDRQLPLELRDIRIVALDHADASDVAATLQRLLDARVTQKASLSKQQADSMRVLVLGEPRSNSLLITGSKDSYELVETLAKELDRVPAALSGRIRLVPLSFADARFLSTSLNTLFSQRYQAAKSPETQRNKPVIVPDSRSNSLLVAAGVDDNAVIDDLLLRLDRKLDDPVMVLTVVGLRHNDATRVATTFEGIFAARLKARTAPGQEASPQDQVRIETDSLNNALIISASKENLELMRGLLDKIDIEPTATGGLLQTFTLQFADASRVATMLRTLVQQGLYRPGMPITGSKGPDSSQREAMAITVDPRSNTLIVSASPENLLVVKEIIRQVDTKDFAELGNIRLYPLKHAKASSLATVLDQFFRAKRTGDSISVNAPERTIPVAVIPDDRVNTLLVTGSKESFDVIERVILQLDGEDAMARMNFKVFPLKQTTAIKLQDTLQRLFVNRPPRIKGEPPEPITVVADGWVNALIVGAAVDDMGMVTSLIDRLDGDQAQLGLTVQVFSLAKADARKVAQTVQGLYREGSPGMTFPVVVTADERLNAVVVSAGESDIKRITDLMKKLDTDQVARVSEIRIFPLRFARAESLSTILNTALNTKPIPLTDQSPNSASLLQFITRGDSGKELVASALREGVLITPDARMNSLIVSAPVDYMGLLEQIITRLDLSSPQQAKIKVFNLVNADARQMSDLLLGLFRLQPQVGQANAANPRAIQYTLLKHTAPPEEDPENPEYFDDPKDMKNEEADGASAVLGSEEQNALHLTVDPRTNSLLVGGTEHYVDLVSEVIQRLDSSSAQERKSEVYRLRNAQASEVQIAIRTFLDQERQRVTQLLGQDAVGTAQRVLEHEVAIVAEPVSNTLLLAANPRYFSQLKQLIERLDQPAPQVLIQVLLAEVTLDSTHELGVEWNITKTVQDAQLATGTDFGVLNDLRQFGGFSTAVTGSDYSFLLRALQTDGRLEVLSRPQILTADNKPASINIGQRVPLVTDSRVTQYGDSISSFQYQNVGVNLTVTPRIGADGAVKMEIGTTNSALSTDSVQVGNGSNGKISAPIINERRATTSVSVQSGQSIIIGGLIASTDDNHTTKVPILGDIPLLGVLFRSKTKITERKELLILLTPQVMVNVDNGAVVSDPETMTNEQLRKSTLRDEIKHDKFRDQLTEPLIPDHKQEAPEATPKPGSTAPQPPKKSPGGNI